MVFESDKFILTKNGVFVRKDYATLGMFKLSLIHDKTLSVYIAEPFLYLAW